MMLYDRILKALEQGPRTLDEMCGDVGMEKFGKDRIAVRSALQRLIHRGQVAHAGFDGVTRYEATGSPRPKPLDEQAHERRMARWSAMVPPEGATAREMAAVFGTSVPCASGRLRRMRIEGYVEMEKVGKLYYYRPRGEA